jgi:uncharacterized membrane protein YgaE (UPF0421/DUF939 family)
MILEIKEMQEHEEFGVRLLAYGLEELYNYAEQTQDSQLKNMVTDLTEKVSNIVKYFDRQKDERSVRRRTKRRIQ